MRTLLRFGPVVVIAVTGAGLIAPNDPASPPTRAIAEHKAPVTVEPTLPLLLEVRLVALPSPARGPGAQAILEIDLEAGADLRDVDLQLLLPDEVRAMDDPLPRGAFALAAGARRAYVTRVSVAGPGVFPLQIEASYRIGEGETIRTRQGAMLRAGEQGDGRSHLGAYEVMAVPLEKWAR